MFDPALRKPLTCTYADFGGPPRTPENSLGLTGGQEAVGSNPTSPTL